MHHFADVSLDIYLGSICALCNKTQDVHWQTEVALHNKTQIITAPLPGRGHQRKHLEQDSGFLSLTSLFNELHAHLLSRLYGSDNNSALFHAQRWGQCHKKLFGNDCHFRQLGDQVGEQIHRRGNRSCPLPWAWTWKAACISKHVYIEGCLAIPPGALWKTQIRFHCATTSL